MSSEDEQMINELAPNNSEAAGIYEPEVDEELSTEEQIERSVIASAIPIIEDLLEWFDVQIAAADSVAQVVATAKTKKLTIDEAMHAHDIVRLLLLSKRDELEARHANFKDTLEPEADDE